MFFSGTIYTPLGYNKYTLHKAINKGKYTVQHILKSLSCQQTEQKKKKKRKSRKTTNKQTNKKNDQKGKEAVA